MTDITCTATEHLDALEKSAPYAFPWSFSQSAIGHSPGMSMRDYFAAKAMQGYVAQSLGTASANDPIQAARWAYQMADAMLEARKS